MAKHLARIHGTEEDKVNCPFYFKIGACRHADRCSRLHHKPAFSPTLLIQHIYRHPLGPNNMTNNGDGNSNGQQEQPQQPLMSPEQQQEDFLCFFEDMYMELSKFGKLEGLHVCDNLGDHMIGHVYVKYYDEEDAADALGVLNGRYYDGRPMAVEYSPVTDFREARCRDYDEEICQRGGYCNFLHVKPVPIPLIRSLEADAEEDRRRYHYEQQRRGGSNMGSDRGIRTNHRPNIHDNNRGGDYMNRSSLPNSNYKASFGNNHHNDNDNRNNIQQPISGGGSGGNRSGSTGSKRKRDKGSKKDDVSRSRSRDDDSGDSRRRRKKDSNKKKSSKKSSKKSTKKNRRDHNNNNDEDGRSYGSSATYSSASSSNSTTSSRKRGGVDDNHNNENYRNESYHDNNTRDSNDDITKKVKAEEN